MDFTLQPEGAQFQACDSISTELIDSIDTLVRLGVQVGDPADTRLPAPSWWLIALSALILFALLCDIQVPMNKNQGISDTRAGGRRPVRNIQTFVSKTLSYGTQTV